MRTKQLAVPILAAVLGGALTAAAMLAGGGTTSSGVSRQGLLTGGGAGDPLSAAEIYERAAPGVVFIRARTVDPGATAFDAEAGALPALSTGSGFVLDEDGLVVTNAHVVTGVTQVHVTFPDDQTVAAQVVGKDEETDLAVLAVNPRGLDLRPLELGDSDAVRPGDQVVAVGNPTGLQATAGTGRVAAAGRRIEAPAGYVIDGVLQTDAVIEPASSGGPLMGPDGRVVGVTVRLAGDGGAGYAVPANTARDVLDVIADGQRLVRTYLGLRGQAVAGGVQVLEVHPDGPADRAGLHAGDIVEAIDGRPVHTLGGLFAAAERRQPGDACTLRVLRDGSRGEIEVRLEERPSTLAAG